MTGIAVITTQLKKNIVEDSDTVNIQPRHFFLLRHSLPCKHFAMTLHVSCYRYFKKLSQHIESESMSMLTTTHPSGKYLEIRRKKNAWVYVLRISK